MSTFLKGMELCENFFADCAKTVIETHFPDLAYSAGLIGYGSDVLGYDDAVSTDHMWGPRFYLFVSERDAARKEELFRTLSENLPYTYQGYSVNYSESDPNDCGVRHPERICSGTVHPLLWIQTFDSYLTEQLGVCDLDRISPCEWLAFSEHRLLSLVSGKFFVDGLRCGERIAKIQYYPPVVRRYLIASNWANIAAEQAFVKRCGDCGDETGSRIICARLCERLMRLCFLYKSVYAPYSKWFGTAFRRLDIDGRIKRAIDGALSASSLLQRETLLVEAQAAVAELHNASGVTEFVPYQIEDYFGRDIKVIFAECFAEAAAKELAGTALENVPLFGSLSQIGGVASIADEERFYKPVMGLYMG